MKCECGNNEFSGTLISYNKVILDEYGEYLRDDTEADDEFESAEIGDDCWCTKCEKEYETSCLRHGDEDDD